MSENGSNLLKFSLPNSGFELTSMAYVYKFDPKMLKLVHMLINRTSLTILFISIFFNFKLN